MTSWRPFREAMGKWEWRKNSGKWIAEGRIYPQIISLDLRDPHFRHKDHTQLEFAIEPRIRFTE